MFWFPAPAEAHPRVLEFLAFEMEYLKGTWDAPKIIISLAIPLFFVMLLASAWQRNWKWLLGVVIGAAVLKVIWSVAYSGDAGLSVILPALVGLIVCVGILVYFIKRSKPSGKNK